MQTADTAPAAHPAIKTSHLAEVKFPNGAVRTAPMPLRVVLRKAVKPLLAILRMRLRLYQLRFQVLVLSIQRPDAITQKGQVLAQHRSRAMLVDERLDLFQERLKHFILLRAYTGASDGSEQGGAA